MNVNWRADGTITIKDTGTSPGDVSLKVIFSDGRADGEGSLNVSVKAPGNLDPITNGDHLVTPVGVSAQLTPMDNDSDPNGGTLRLTQVDEAPAGLSVTSDLPTGVLTFTPTAEGTYYLNYQVSNGPKTASGFIRLMPLRAQKNLCQLCKMTSPLCLRVARLWWPPWITTLTPPGACCQSSQLKPLTAPRWWPQFWSTGS